MTAFFSRQDVAVLEHGHAEARLQFEDLRERFLMSAYRTERGREFAAHGFCRRLGTMIRAIDQVFEILPPARDDVPAHREVVDATIAIQSFVLNAFGCLDNLAWMLVCEKDLKGEGGRAMDPLHVGLGRKNTSVRRGLSVEFLALLDRREPWLMHIKGLRDSLAHRIPLYVPPYIVAPASIDEYNRLGAKMPRSSAEEYARLKSQQLALVHYRPWMTHSAFEGAPKVVFHRQLLQDQCTIDELARAALSEIRP